MEDLMQMFTEGPTSDTLDDVSGAIAAGKEVVDCPGKVLDKVMGAVFGGITAILAPGLAPITGLGGQLLGKLLNNVVSCEEARRALAKNIEGCLSAMKGGVYDELIGIVPRSRVTQNRYGDRVIGQRLSGIAYDGYLDGTPSADRVRKLFARGVVEAYSIGIEIPDAVAHVTQWFWTSGYYYGPYRDVHVWHDIEQLENVINGRIDDLKNRREQAIYQSQSSDSVVHPQGIGADYSFTVKQIPEAKSLLDPLIGLINRCIAGSVVESAKELYPSEYASQAGRVDQVMGQMIPTVSYTTPGGRNILPLLILGGGIAALGVVLAGRNE